MSFKQMVKCKAGDTWETIFLNRDTGGSKEKKSDPPVSLLKQVFLKIIILHQKWRYQSDLIQSGVWSDPESDLIWNPIRSGIQSRFCERPIMLES